MRTTYNSVSGPITHGEARVGFLVRSDARRLEATGVGVKSMSFAASLDWKRAHIGTLELYCQRSIGFDVQIRRFASQDARDAFLRRQNQKPPHYTHWQPAR